MSSVAYAFLMGRATAGLELAAPLALNLAGLDLAALALAWLAFAFAMGAFTLRLRAFRRLNRPSERAPVRGSVPAGVVYAFTLGMAPWAKESTRRHWVSYLRGVAFHLGIFLGIAVFLAAPWLDNAPPAWRSALAWSALLGALLGLAGLALRLVEPNLKRLSTPDDYFAVLLVSLFLAAAGLWLLGWLPAAVFYLLSAGLWVYAPFSKIRHCLYFAYSRLFYGRFVGSREVLPHAARTGDA